MHVSGLPRGVALLPFLVRHFSRAMQQEGPIALAIQRYVARFCGHQHRTAGSKHNVTAGGAHAGQDLCYVFVPRSLSVVIAHSLSGMVLV